MIELTLDEMGLDFLLVSEKKINPRVLSEFSKYIHTEKNNKNYYSFEQRPNNAFILNAILSTSKNIQTNEETKQIIDNLLKKVVQPKVYLYDDTHVGLDIPNLTYYQNIMTQLGGYARSYTTYTVAFSRAFEVIRVLNSLNSFLPNFIIDDSIKNVLLTPLESFDGSIPSLINANITELYSVNHAYKAKPENFEKMGYNTPIDFLLKRPIRYIDKTKVVPIEKWKIDEEVVFVAKIEDKQVIKQEHVKFILNVSGRKVECMFYRRAWMSEKYRIGEEVLVIAKPSKYKNLTGLSMDSLIEANSLPIVPIYSQSAKNKINTKTIMNCVYEMIERLKGQTDEIGGYFPDEVFPMTLQNAVQSLHFPKDIEDYKEALNILALIELTYMQILIQHKKATEVKKRGVSKPYKKDGLADLARDGLPWELTNGQKSALIKISELLESNSAEEALLSADVGSGKTLIAQLACLQAVDNGYQAVLAAPTEVLAQQLYKSFLEVIAGIPEKLRPSIVYLSGDTKAAEKRQIYKSIQFGEVDLIVGTHSVLSTKVPYKNLGLVIIDEQQKFGALQRRALLESRDDGLMPDLINQTATPIPRSTAQIYYGDINLITVNEKPKGRKEIVTKWIKEDPRLLIKDKKSIIWNDIKKESKLGHKTFIVVPMVYENEKMNIASISETAKALKTTLPDVEIEYLHGKMTKKEQKERIDNFKNGTASVMIASTVIEVGVDISAATRMIILSADRMGASSLHQIRGRVGRNDLESICYLVSENDKDSSASRLQALVDSNDGFYIATIDLKTRGEGDLFGAKQSGDNIFTFANLVDHSELIDKAKNIAETIYKTPRKIEAILDAKSILKIDNDNKEDL